MFLSSVNRRNRAFALDSKALPQLSLTEKRRYWITFLLFIIQLTAWYFTIEFALVIVFSRCSITFLFLTHQKQRKMKTINWKGEGMNRGEEGTGGERKKTYHNDEDDSHNSRQPYEEVFLFSRSAPWLFSLIPFVSPWIRSIVINDDSTWERKRSSRKRKEGRTYTCIHRLPWSNEIGNTQIEQRLLGDKQSSWRKSSLDTQDIQCWSDHNCCLQRERL